MNDRDRRWLRAIVAIQLLILVKLEDDVFWSGAFLVLVFVILLVNVTESALEWYHKRLARKIQARFSDDE